MKAAVPDVILAKDGVRGGGPDAVIEIRSPGDETYDKFPFFAALGVREVVVVDRDTKRPEVHRIDRSHYAPVAATADGFVTAEVLGVRFPVEPAETPLLVVEDTAHAFLRVEI